MDTNSLKLAHSHLVSRIGNTFKGKKQIDIVFKLSEDRLHILVINDTSGNTGVIATRPSANFVYWQPGPICEGPLFTILDQICNQHADESRGSGAERGPRDLKMLKLLQDTFRKMASF